MSYKWARQNGRTIPAEDKIFALSGRAKAMMEKEGKEKVINATIGTLLDDSGNIAIISSVMDAAAALKPTDICEYAPIGGTPDFKATVKKAALGSYETGSGVEVVASPGGTGALRNAVANYSAEGEKVLTSDWFWGPYKTITGELGRQLATFPLFDENMGFNIDGFEEQVNEICARQEGLLIMLNTPAHNPTGYSMTDGDWDKVIEVLKKQPSHKKLALLADTAYIDFAGDSEKYRTFVRKMDSMPENIVPLIAYSFSKTLTIYGLRVGALICLAKTPEMGEEFLKVCQFSSRGTWSNCVKAGQVLASNIYKDETLFAKVEAERKKFRDMLAARGRAFSCGVEEAGLPLIPYDSGFFACIPCDDPAGVSARLEKKGVFVVPLAMGLRVSVASVPEDVCRKLPGIIADEIRQG